MRTRHSFLQENSYIDAFEHERFLSSTLFASHDYNHRIPHRHALRDNRIGFYILKFNELVFDSDKPQYSIGNFLMLYLLAHEFPFSSSLDSAIKDVKKYFIDYKENYDAKYSLKQQRYHQLRILKEVDDWAKILRDVGLIDYNEKEPWKNGTQVRETLLKMLSEFFSSSPAKK